MPLNKRAIFCIKKFRRNVPHAARWELTYTSWKCLQQNTTAEPVGKGALLSTNGEGCKYENKSPVQSDEAQSPHGHPSSRIWTWISTTGWGPRSLLDSSSSPLVFAATLGAARLADWRSSSFLSHRGAERDQHHPEGEGPAPICHPLWREVGTNWTASI